MLGDYDWRLSEKNIWKVERMLLEYPHRPIRSSDGGSTGCARATSPSGGSSPGRKPVDYRGREHWTELPGEFIGS